MQLSFPETNEAISIVALIAWFAVLFTGTYPEGLRRLMIGFM
jgi:hypothetical protein